MGKKRTRRRKKRSKFGRYLYAVVVLGLMIANTVLTILLMFHVQKMTVTGVTYSDEKEILAWVQEDTYTDNAIYACAKFWRKDYELPIYLDGVELHMKAPWSLEIAVQEKEILAGAMIDGAYLYFDREGLVLVSGTTVLEGVPLVEGMVVQGASQYEYATLAKEDVLVYLEELVEGLQQNQLSPERIVWENHSITLHFGGVRAQLGEVNLEEKLVQLPPILVQLEGKQGVLHLEHYIEVSSNISFEEDME